MTDEVADDGPDRAAWPRWATEPVRLVPSDPSWQVDGEQLALEVAARLASVGAPRVHHVGSTAVAGLAAKPILDLLAEVDGQAATPDAVADAALAALAPGEWHLVPPELDARPWRRLLVLVREERRAAHLHLVDADHPHVGELLAFRDALRSDPELAARYADLKRELAAGHVADREAYTAGKDAFVAEVLRSAHGRPAT